MSKARTPKPVPTPPPVSADAKKATAPSATPVASPVAAPRLRRKGRVAVPAQKRAVTATKKGTVATEKPKKVTAKPGKTTNRAGLSALDAAAKVLEGLKGAEARDGIGANDLVERMQRARLWTSPGGKTPAATLYAAMTREIAAKKGDARFARVSPGRFTSKGVAKARRGNGAE